MAKKTDPLDAWLDRVDAKECWTVAVPGIGATTGKLTGYLINNALAMVLRYADDHGWELLIPASNKNDVTHTIDAAAIALGVDGCRGLVDVAAHVAKAKGGA